MERKKSSNSDNQQKPFSLDDIDVADFAVNMLSGIVGKNTEQTVKAITHKDIMGNVAIFVDYDNIYWTLQNNYAHDPDSADTNKNLFDSIWKRYGNDNVRTFRAYADFQKVKTSLTSLQKKRVQIRHVYSNDKQGDYRKNSSDIELCIDAIESTYKDPSITCYVIVTADSDMIPILSRLMFKGKRVELFYLSNALPHHINMTNFAHYSEDLIEFLNVEINEVNIDDFIIPALMYIQGWYENYGESDKFLGASWLQNQLSKEFKIPSNLISELIEKLQIEDLIQDGIKEINGTKKTSLTLTENGIKRIISTVK